MKIKIFYIVLFMFLSISCNEYSFQLDDILLECYDSTYQEEGYDIKTIIEDYETSLVNAGILKDDTGKSYLEVYQKIISKKDFNISSSTFQEYDPWHKVDKEIAVAVFECERKLIELAKQKETKWRVLFSIFETPETNETPEMLYQAMVENLSESDLNSYYFKLKMFHIFDMVNLKSQNKSLTVIESNK